MMLKHEFILQRMNHYYANMPWCGGMLSDESWKFDLHESIDGRRKVLNIIALLLRILKCSKYFYGYKPFCICNLFDGMTFGKIILQLFILSTQKGVSRSSKWCTNKVLIEFLAMILVLHHEKAISITKVAILGLFIISNTGWQSVLSTLTISKFYNQLNLSASSPSAF